MCLFSGPVHHVSGTRIYAGPRDNGNSIHQRIAYAMKVDVPEPLAMVLPIPTPPNPPEDAVTFVDMSSVPTFFENLDLLFPPAPASGGYGAPMGRSMGAPQTLKVHDVGNFEASFVPTLRDFARLDARFRLPENVWAQLPQYGDWSFCVFKLRGHGTGYYEEKKSIWSTPFLDYFKPKSSTPSLPIEHHPMAFDFPRRNPKELFFPTVHVHDGAVHPEADFDHTLYAQLDNFLTPAGWEQSYRPSDTLIDHVRTFVRPERPMFRKKVVGHHPNLDITVATYA